MTVLTARILWHEFFCEPEPNDFTRSVTVAAVRQMSVSLSDWGEGSRQETTMLLAFLCFSNSYSFWHHIWHRAKFCPCVSVCACTCMRDSHFIEWAFTRVAKRPTVSDYICFLSFIVLYLLFHPAALPDPEMVEWQKPFFSS